MEPTRVHGRLATTSEIKDIERAETIREQSDAVADRMLDRFMLLSAGMLVILTVGVSATIPAWSRGAAFVLSLAAMSASVGGMFPRRVVAGRLQIREIEAAVLDRKTWWLRCAGTAFALGLAAVVAGLTVYAMGF